MKTAPTLLDEVGEASIATALMMSHHGFRRDLVRFAAALPALNPGASNSLEPLRAEWRSLRNTLHGHHASEDGGLFPALGAQHPALRPTFERLTADHRRIDPLLERGDEAFGGLSETVAAAKVVISELTGLLDAHLATEEAEVIPYMRAMKGFPPPATPEEAEMYAQGFAWASHGIAPAVLAQVDAMLPAVVTSRLPAARAAFEQRWRAVWGPVAVGATATSIPER